MGRHETRHLHRLGSPAVAFHGLHAEDKNARVRLRAVQALHSGRFTDAVPRIEAMLKIEGDPDVISIAKDAIQLLKRSW